VDAPPAIELRGVSRRYGERLALADVSVTVPAGATLVVFGPNGAGKSTLLRVLATLLRPHGGATVVLGEPLPARQWAVRGRVGLLAHDALLYRDLSARENLRFHARLHGVPERRVEELLDRVELRGRADDPVRTLSRGLLLGYEVLERARKQDPEVVPLMVLLTDGQANVSMTDLPPQAESYALADFIAAQSIKAVVIDTEHPIFERGLARQLAQHLKGRYYRLDDLREGGLVDLVRAELNG